MKPLSKSTVQNATIQLRQGKSCQEVSKNLNISISSAQRIRKDDKGNIPVPKGGRPSKVSERTRRTLARDFDTGELETLKEGQQLVESTEGVQVDKRSIRRYLKMENMKTYVKQKRPDLTKSQMDARYKFAKDHLNWTVEDWKNVMFSDETIISRIGSYGRKFYYKRPGDKNLRPHHVKKTKQGGGGKMMIWGCITCYGPGDACWFQDKVDAVTYVDVLKDYVFGSRDYHSMDPTNFVFQQDNARIHTAKITMDYIKKSNIPVMIWPVNSPDLNPIETVWAYLKKQLDLYRNKPKNMNELWEQVQDIWTNIPSEFLQNLYESMPERMRALYNSKGGHIKY